MNVIRKIDLFRRFNEGTFYYDFQSKQTVIQNYKWKLMKDSCENKTFS